jgi:molybdate transport system ATP-binding protein
LADKLANPHHSLTVTGLRGTVRLDIALELRAPWTVLFGPSGSGKSTILRAACGLTPHLQTSFHRHEAGEAQELTTTPIYQRHIAYAPQGAAIFPHLTVRENIAYSSFALGSKKPTLFPRDSRRDSASPAAMRASASKPTEKADLIDTAIELFLLGAMIHRQPRSLSGGERQRVALARAFAVPNASLMLLDEPFTGIDRRMRDSLLPRMIERAASLNIPVVSVTHDVEEALLLEAEVIRLSAGRITTRGPARDVLYEERTRMRAVIE